MRWDGGGGVRTEGIETAETAQSGGLSIEVRFLVHHFGSVGGL